MRAPQIIMIVLLSVEVSLAALMNGKEREDKRYHFGRHLISHSIIALILWWGGFWS